MLKSNPILLSVLLLLLASLACGAPTVTVYTPDANVLGTMVAQTLVVMGTQTAQALVPIPGLASPTLTPELPTLSPTVTVTPLPVFTSTSTVPLISVTVATNCRVGPGRAYDRIGALMVGEVAEVVGRNPNGNYWYIRNPDSSNGFCWLWGEYATLVGNVGALPVYTPPPTPTPTPDFTVRYAGLETCAGWWVDFRLENTGGMNFRSVSITLRDATSNVILSLTTTGFTNSDGCTGSNTRDNLRPGDRGVVSMSPFNYDPTGHELRATITLCSDPSATGLCVSKVIEFKP
jgi:hypothetical protein